MNKLQLVEAIKNIDNGHGFDITKGDGLSDNFGFRCIDILGTSQFVYGMMGSNGIILATDLFTEEEIAEKVISYMKDWEADDLDNYRMIEVSEF
jgi:hypothetical protein